ncbi:hypothetical protein EV199_3494 [Pseudobacter ginsenosidimutans]|uniref:Carboxypeptidase family protein n=2 Tax=Pseudobacter ginsenosidimutans TaxID=661488 RepID=A0A4Q7MUG1_9BACT|nr:carboxypeptidase regulatory-like domain-containing protein [Pseudobacter ginsenosidimutans]RZS71589.1 hypothetical protein EV199_3494 [Pseudobacter ginsenosidimutans]
MGKKLGLSLLAFLMLTVLSSYTSIFCKKGGIKGLIYLVKGNQMPSPGQMLPPKKPLQTTLYIYELTNINQVTRAEAHAPFYTAINTKLIKQVNSDTKGEFKVKLPPGQYSLFIKKDDRFYANLFDEKNNIAPVTVVKGKYTDVEVRADYDAVY